VVATKEGGVTVRGYLTNLSTGVYGRFANQAYQVCAVIGIARRNDLIPVFPLWENKDHRDRFGSSEDVEIYRHLVNPLPPLPGGIAFTHRAVDWGYHETVLSAGNWNISGHFQSERYFEHCIDECRWYLRMKDEPPQNDYVAIHWRAGDYSSGDGYHPRMTMDYYRPAMAKFHGARFLVFSDDIPAAKEMFGLSVEYSEGRDYLEDFKLLKKCRHYIIANSSYSAIAAVLSDAPDKQLLHRARGLDRHMRKLRVSIFMVQRGR
jgi:hypothetical protein